MFLGNDVPLIVVGSLAALNLDVYSRSIGKRREIVRHRLVVPLRIRAREKR